MTLEENLPKFRLLKKVGKIFGFLVLLFFTLIVGVAIGLADDSPPVVNTTVKSDNVEVAKPVVDTASEEFDFDEYIDDYWEQHPERDPCNKQFAIAYGLC